MNKRYVHTFSPFTEDLLEGHRPLVSLAEAFYYWPYTDNILFRHFQADVVVELETTFGSYPNPYVDNVLLWLESASKQFIPIEDSKSLTGISVVENPQYIQKVGDLSGSVFPNLNPLLGDILLYHERLAKIQQELRPGPDVKMFCNSFSLSGDIPRCPSKVAIHSCIMTAPGAIYLKYPPELSKDIPLTMACFFNPVFGGVTRELLLVSEHGAGVSSHFSCSVYENPVTAIKNPEFSEVEVESLHNQALATYSKMVSLL